ncbi:hypothetical protein POVWA2_071760 [Plasmodium ovale wallikeri]|uniref:Uncharacterized protein n=1 Tax=Plasmodium ovale wallikeri TaxID=864142 RepID=A0A1A8YM52_PLAOA|nr:hypothetical protein POVWA1_012790 [Plasmodium ovale wallikeri]SBT56155.1 hypothetical protein POVWA2_071760 [Plasmodium ovale wallikeri]
MCTSLHTNAEAAIHGFLCAFLHTFASCEVRGEHLPLEGIKKNRWENGNIEKPELPLFFVCVVVVKWR